MASQDKQFNTARANLAFSQSLVDKFRQPQAQPMDMGISQTTPQNITPIEAVQTPQNAPQQGVGVNIGNTLHNVGNSALDLVSSHVSATNPPVAEPQPVDIRGVQAKPQDVQKLKQAIFSEVSNRLSPIEITAMANVALNKAKQEGKPLGEIVSDPNFFQGITNTRYATNTPEGPDKKVADFINATIDEYLAGNGADHTNGATHFVHITKGKGKDKLVTMNEKEFSNYLSKKGSERDVYAESLLSD